MSLREAGLKSSVWGNRRGTNRKFKGGVEGNGVFYNAYRFEKLARRRIKQRVRSTDSAKSKKYSAENVRHSSN
jgi:hypothetical protein